MVGGVTAISTGAGAPAGVVGVSLGIPTMGFGFSKIINGFQGGERKDPGGMVEATAIGVGAPKSVVNVAQMGDIFSGGLPKDMITGALMSYDIYNSNFGQSFGSQSMPIQNYNQQNFDNTFTAPRDNTTVIINHQINF